MFSKFVYWVFLSVTCGTIALWNTGMPLKQAVIVSWFAFLALRLKP
jgi:hypothetical protein